jgi:hypothetical protein
VETKRNFKESDVEQLFCYVKLEQRCNQNGIVAILANTENDKNRTWKITGDGQCEELAGTKLRTMAEYAKEFLPAVTNDMEKFTKATYQLNELLHKNDIDEDLRSQFVGTCLLALKSRIFVAKSGMSTNQIAAGIGDVLR